MNTLIRHVAELISAFLERGSLWGAALGAVVGAAMGFAIAYALHVSDLLDRYWIGAAIAMGIALALAVGAAGSRLFPHDLPARGEDVLLTNLNHALVAPAFLLGLSALVAFWVSHELRTNGFMNWREPAFFFIVAVMLVFMIVTMRVRFAVRVGKEIVFYRVWQTRRFPREQLRDWGFEVGRGKYSRIPPLEPTLFQLELQDQAPFEKVVSPTTAQRLVDALGGTMSHDTRGTRP